MNKQKQIEFLQNVKTLFNNMGWTQGSYARDPEGRQEPYYSDKACSFCLVGALRSVREEGGYIYEDFTDTIVDLNKFITGNCHDVYESTDDLIDFNDDKKMTKETIIQTIDNYIAFLNNKKK